MKTAHLINYNIAGLVAVMMVCFGDDGKLEPGCYVGYMVSDIEHARRVAIEHDAVPYNF